jgi:hypothetical protein
VFNRLFLERRKIKEEGEAVFFGFAAEKTIPLDL